MPTTTPVDWKKLFIIISIVLAVLIVDCLLFWGLPVLIFGKETILQIYKWVIVGLGMLIAYFLIKEID